MKVAVWDTYVKTENNIVLHFDIIVPENVKDEKTIFSYGKQYLLEIKQDGKIHSNNCQFCHIEEPSDEVVKSIEEKGFYIYRMEDIPAKLPDNPTRKDIVLYIKGHSDKYRYVHFKKYSDEEIKKILQEVIEHNLLQS